MSQQTLSKEEISRLGETIYRERVRAEVETDANIGKMVIMDVNTGDYELGMENGIQAAQRLYVRRPGAILYGVRIGYRVAAAIGGVMERTTQ